MHRVRPGGTPRQDLPLGGRDLDTSKPAAILMENYSKRELERLRELRHPPYFYFYQQAQGRNTAIQIEPTDFSLLDRRNSQGPYVVSIDAALRDTGSFNVAQEVWDVATRPLHLRTQLRAQCGFASFEMYAGLIISISTVDPGENANGPALISRLRVEFPSIISSRSNLTDRKPSDSPVTAKQSQQARFLCRLPRVVGCDYIFEFVHHPSVEAIRSTPRRFWIGNQKNTTSRPDAALLVRPAFWLRRCSCCDRIVRSLRKLPASSAP